MPSPPKSSLVFFPTPNDFRKWLAKNHDKEEVLQVGYYKKATGKPSVTWEETVDQALCFGWIDGIRHAIDEECYTVRFTPRKKGSNWSARNIEQVKDLKKQGLMEKPGLDAYKKRLENKSNTYSYEQGKLKMEKAYETKIKANKKAWEYYKKLPPSAMKSTVWWVMSAKQETTREKRLGILIESSEQGLRIPPIRRK